MFSLNHRGEISSREHTEGSPARDYAKTNPCASDIASILTTNRRGREMKEKVKRERIYKKRGEGERGR